MYESRFFKTAKCTMRARQKNSKGINIERRLELRNNQKEKGILQFDIIIGEVFPTQDPK